MFDNLKKWVVEQVLWAEANMKGKSGKEKRQAVVDKIDDMLVLPWWLEYFDGPLIGMLVDKACGLFNEAEGHEWTDTSEPVAEAVARGLPDPKEAVKKTKETATEKLDGLYQKYGVGKANEAEAKTEPEPKPAEAGPAPTKLEGDKLSEHFNKKEFACKCCGKFIPCPELIEKLEKFRALCGNKPITLSNGTRCEKHNKEVGGAAKSQHLYGTAADVQKVSGLTVDQMAKLAEQAGFDGIGKYNWGVHVDVRGTPARWDSRKK